MRDKDLEIEDMLDPALVNEPLSPRELQLLNDRRHDTSNIVSRFLETLDEKEEEHDVVNIRFTVLHVVTVVCTSTAMAVVGFVFGWFVRGHF